MPAGRSIEFSPLSDIAIRDGGAAVELRSHQGGTIELEASSPGLRSAKLSLQAAGGPAFVAGGTPLVADRLYSVPKMMAQPGQLTDVALGLPPDASSHLPNHSIRLADDGDGGTYWQPATDNAKAPWWQIDSGGICNVQELHVSFAGEHPPFLVQLPDAHGNWRTVLHGSAGTSSSTMTFPAGVQRRLVRLTFSNPSTSPKAPRFKSSALL